MKKRSDSELAAELVLGLLEESARSAAKKRIVEDTSFATLVDCWEQRLAPLAVLEYAQPSAQLFERIEARIAGLGSELPGTTTRRAGTGEWIDAAPGLRIKVLNRIEALNRQTIMAELQPGAKYVDHDHSQDEEIYMIEGDLVIGELVLGPGDFHIARAGRRHPVHTSRTGCICIISQAVD